MPTNTQTWPTAVRRAIGRCALMMAVGSGWVAPAHASHFPAHVVSAAVVLEPIVFASAEPGSTASVSTELASSAPASSAPVSPPASTAYTLVPYNFTSYPLEYRLGDGVTDTLPAHSANGASAQLLAYRPASAQEPLRLSWRYLPADGGQVSSRTFEATLQQPARPPGRSVLTLRFYPEGRVAARYTDAPEMSDRGNVAAELPGDGWVTQP